jgi:pimeloyl-ACP methyl ester carboxylesterase
MPVLDTLAAVSLGGVDQWIRLRSRDPSRPVLLVLYGGPSLPLLPRVTDLGERARLEKHFTVAYSEQRGTGKSYRPSLSPDAMTIDRFVTDVIELTDHLRERFDLETIGLFGTSWGSVLGLRALARAPERFWGYVGAGQLVDVRESDRQSYEFTLEEARRRENADAVAALESIGPPPYSPTEMMTQRKWLGKFGGMRHDTSPPGPVARLWDVLTTSAYSWRDAWQIAGDPFFALNHLLDELSEVDLTDEIDQVKRPVHLLHGRHDRLAPPSLARSYLNRLDAPTKEWIWFEDSAHFPFLEEPERFGRVLGQVADDAAPPRSP